MSSSHTIEHIVLFKLKATTDQPSDADVDAAADGDKMVSRINGLISLDQVLHITAVPLRRVRSTSSELSFTHILHSRFRSKHDLTAYAVHPAHLRVVSENAPLVDDILAVDWVADYLIGSVIPPPGSAVRVALWKLKEGVSGDERKSEILEAIRGIKEELGGVSQFSFGENFSPERAKGFEMAFLIVFSNVRILESADSEQWEEKFKDFVDSLLVLDFVVPSNSSEQSFGS
ncbi:hypothetical protein TIFTF001_022178 [Ficus carica]|uniref:Stress-response A/B barrel domain-containing protein n=1 Tax=Ficus carica TaxID=3494 RepID=A0AA88AVJ1_FICCA|nr:hypothetical protein TIFTF001_022178 [Ficus carica]